MQRVPRSLSEKILTRQRWFIVAISSVTMAVGTILVLALAPGAEPKVGTATIAGTMAFNTFVLFQFFNILNVRSERDSVFSRYTLGNGRLWSALGVVIALQVGVTHWGPLQDLFDTASINFKQWVVCIAVASSVLWLEELRKVLVRSRSARVN